MYIQEIRTKGIKGIHDEIFMSFKPDLKQKSFEENIEKFNLDDPKYQDFWVLKQICISGTNASGKTSILKSIELGFEALLRVDFTSYIKYLNDIGMGVLYNLFCEQILWEFKIIFKEKDVVKKYNIILKIKQNMFIEEELRYQEVNAKGKISKEKTLFKQEAQKLTLFKTKSESTSYNHHSNNMSILSMVRNATINPQIARFFTEHKTFLRKIDAIISKKEETKLTLFNSPKYLEFLNQDLNFIDNSISNINFNNYGKVILNINHLDKTESITGINEVDSLISEGTKNWINFVDLLFKRNQREGSLIALVDELGRSLHVSAIRKQWEKIIENQSQIIFTTHNNDFFKFELRSDQFFKISNTNKKDLTISRFSDSYNDERMDLFYDKLVDFIGL